MWFLWFRWTTESEKKNKYLDFVRELKKLWNMRIKIIPILVGVLGTVPKNLEKELMGLEIRWENRNHQDKGIAEIS